MVGVVSIVEYHQIFYFPFSFGGYKPWKKKTSFLMRVFLAAAAHPNETQLHSSLLTYDLYNPSVGIYHPGAENTHNLT